MKAKKFANRLLSANLTSAEASLAYHTMFLPGMLYSSGITWLSRQQCETIQKIARPAWLNALGFNRHFPQAVAYAPRKWAGLALAHHYHEQGFRGVFTFVGQVKSNSEVGKIVTIGMEYFRMIVGFEACPFANPSSMVSKIYEEKDWFIFIHDFLLAFGMSIEFPTQSYMRKKCVRDCALMESLSDVWSRAEVRAFNRCRMYSRVWFVSDIASGDGRRILHGFMRGTTRAESSLSWPHQHRPSDSDWQVWRKILKRDFMTEAGTLRRSLGAWYDDANRHHRVWPGYMNNKKTKIWRQQQDQWETFSIISLN